MAMMSTPQDGDYRNVLWWGGDGLLMLKDKMNFVIIGTDICLLSTFILSPRCNVCVQISVTG